MVPELLPIPAGKIILRDDRLQKVWVEEVAGFLMSTFPITQKAYEMVMGNNPSAFLQPNHPVEQVSWQHAASFCNRLSQLESLEPCYLDQGHGEPFQLDLAADGFRLPTEAEWEYACRAGTTGIRYGALEDIAWYRENSKHSPQPVGQKAPNAWGLYDMLGNVWEWCTDVYDETVYGTYRIIRGGGWYDEARGVMATNRRRSHPLAYRMDDLGFRVVRTLPP